MANNDTSMIYVSGTRRSIAAVLIAGLGVGAIGWALSVALQTWIITPYLCQNAQTASICENGGGISWTVAMIILSIVGLLALVRAGVFRPLLVVIASLIALWGAATWLSPLVWWQSLLWNGALFALSYGLFAWIARLRNFLLALILTIACIIAARLVVITL